MTDETYELVQSDYRYARQLAARAGVESRRTWLRCYSEWASMKCFIDRYITIIDGA